MSDTNTNTHKKRKKSRRAKSSHTIRVTKHSRKSRRTHRGNGPDLKAITTESPFQEDSTNGVNPIETNGPVK